MQLRTHPKTKWEGFFNWPPAWGGSYGRGDIFPAPERAKYLARPPWLTLTLTGRRE